MSEEGTTEVLARLEARFRPLLGMLVAFYLLLETLYVMRLPLVTDEFQGFYSVTRLRSMLPYVDFVPYKTVLGYYLQLPLIFISEDPWRQMITIKLGMAVAVAATIFASGCLLARHFRPAAVLLATLLLVFMSTFLERSAVLRVDMLTGLAGLLGLICLLERRIAAAGLMTGISFLISQKGAYYALAGGAAVAGHALLFARDRGSLLQILRFGGATAAPVILYFGLWTALASYDAVFDQVVVKGAGVASATFYEIRHFWLQTLSRNPLFWLLGLLALGQLVASRGRSSRPRTDWTLLLYGTTLLGLCVWHKQPWPYFFVLLIPTAWVLVASFCDVVMTRRSVDPRVAVAVLVALGVALPASRIPTVLARDNAFQRFNVSAAHTILDERDTYLAGLEMVASRRQASRKLSWLDRPKLDRLGEKDVGSLVRELSGSRMKLVIVNYRIPELPPPILGYLQANYWPLVGNILIYAPSFEAGSHTLEIPFTGRYRVLGPPGARLEVDGHIARPGEGIELAEGAHQLVSSTPGRLQLLPAGFEGGVEKRFLQQQPLFDDNYTY